MKDKKYPWERVGGRKFAFAVFVLLFVLASIVLNTILLVKKFITPVVYKDLFIFSGGFISLIASSYFYVNAKSKQYYNEYVDKLRKQINGGNKGE